MNESKENNPERMYHILGHLSQRIEECQHACCRTCTQTYRLLQLFLQNSWLGRLKPQSSRKHFSEAVNTSFLLAGGVSHGCWRLWWWCHTAKNTFTMTQLFGLMVRVCFRVSLQLHSPSRLSYPATGQTECRDQGEGWRKTQVCLEVTWHMATLTYCVIINLHLLTKSRRIQLNSAQTRLNAQRVLSGVNTAAQRVRRHT